MEAVNLHQHLCVCLHVFWIFRWTMTTVFLSWWIRGVNRQKHVQREETSRRTQNENSHAVSGFWPDHQTTPFLCLVLRADARLEERETSWCQERTENSPDREWSRAKHAERLREGEPAETELKRERLNDRLIDEERKRQSEWRGEM